jgi:hypothetical protein
MTSVWHCSVCDRNFSSLESYQNHTCNAKTYGGASDLRKAKEEFHETEGGTGER